MRNNIIDLSTNFIEWDVYWETGNEFIDIQHKHLIGIVNKISLLFRQNLNSVEFKVEEVAQNLQELMEYTRYHFEAEEIIMKIAEYPDLQSHIVIHRRLTTQLEQMIQKFQENEKLVVPMILNFLQLWLRDHILDIDKKYIGYVKEHDVPM